MDLVVSSFPLLLVVVAAPFHSTRDQTLGNIVSPSRSASVAAAAIFLLLRSQSFYFYFLFCSA